MNSIRLSSRLVVRLLARRGVLPRAVAVRGQSGENNPKPWTAEIPIPQEELNEKFKPSIGLAVFEQDLPFWVKSEADKLMFTAGNLEQLLNSAKALVKDGNVLATHPTISLFANAAKMVPDPAESSGDTSEMKRFLEDGFVCGCLQKLILEIPRLLVGDISLAMKSLLRLGMRTDDWRMEALSDAFEENFVRLNISSLINFASIYANYQYQSAKATVLQRKIVDSIHERVREVTSIDDVLTLMSKFPFNLSWQLKLENILLESSDELSELQAVRLLNLMVENRSRNLTIIKAVAAALQRKDDLDRSKCLSLSHLKSLLLASSKLHIFDPKVLSRISNDLIVRVDELKNTTDISYILSSIARLRMRNSALFDAIAKRTATLIRDSPEVAPRDLVYIVLTFAKCNFKPNSREMLNLIREKVKQEQLNNNQLWLNYVNSLAILKALTPELAESVLGQEFYDVVLSTEIAFHRLNNKLKLMAVDACAALEIKGYKGPRLDPKVFAVTDAEAYEVSGFKHGTDRKTGEVRNPLALAFKEILRFMTANKAENFFVNRYGHFLESEICLDSKGEIIPKDTKEKNFTKVAVFFWGFNHYTTGAENYLTGHHAMAVRHMKAAGYEVLEVRDAEFMMRSRFIDRQNYMKDRLKKLVPP